MTVFFIFFPHLFAIHKHRQEYKCEDAMSINIMSVTCVKQIWTVTERNFFPVRIVTAQFATQIKDTNILVEKNQKINY